MSLLFGHVILVGGYLVSMMLCNVVVVFLLVGHMCLQIMLQAMLIMKRVPWVSIFMYAYGCVPICIVTVVRSEAQWSFAITRHG